MNLLHIAMEVLKPKELPLEEGREGEREGEREGGGERDREKERQMSSPNMIWIILIH